MSIKKMSRPRCPECRSVLLTKDGTQVSHRKKVQRWLCHHCWRRTIYPRGDGKEAS